MHIEIWFTLLVLNTINDKKTKIVQWRVEAWGVGWVGGEGVQFIKFRKSLVSISQCLGSFIFRNWNSSFIPPYA